MLIILSPAKTMDMSPAPVGIPVTEAEFRNDAELLAAKMRRYSLEELATLLKISPKLARENYTRYQQFDAPENSTKQALLAYNGSVFKHMAPGAWSVEDLEYAQTHLRIVSTLYGLLRPLDRIKAYRMTYEVKLQGLSGNLYDYWQPVLTDPLIAAVNNAGGVLVNLASLDVLGAFDMARVRQQAAQQPLGDGAHLRQNGTRRDGTVYFATADREARTIEGICLARLPIQRSTVR